MRTLVILGAGGFAREVADIVQDLGPESGLDLLGFIDRDDETVGSVLNGTRILGTLATADLSGEVWGILGSGDIEPRARQIAEMEAAGIRPLTLIHPSVVMSSFVGVGEGTVVAAGAVVTNGTTIGRHVLVNYNTTVGHDVEIGDRCVLGPGAHISGWCVLEEECYIGTSAVVLPRVRVGRGAVVGAGAVVTSNVEPGVTVVGVPATPLRQE